MPHDDAELNMAVARALGYEMVWAMGEAFWRRGDEPADYLPAYSTTHRAWAALDDFKKQHPDLAFWLFGGTDNLWQAELVEWRDGNARRKAFGEADARCKAICLAIIEMARMKREDREWAEQHKVSQENANAP